MGKILQEEQKNLIYKHQFTHGVEMRSYHTREVDDFQMHLHNFRITSDPIRKNILSFIKKSGTTSSHKSIAVLSGENIKTDKSIRIFNKGRIITYKKQGTFIEEQINKYLPKKISFEIKEISKKTDLYLLNRTLYKGSSDSRVGAVNKPIDIFNTVCYEINRNFNEVKYLIIKAIYSLTGFALLLLLMSFSMRKPKVLNV